VVEPRDLPITGTNQSTGTGSLPPPGADPISRPSVLLVGQRSLGAQRRGRFVAGSGAHPARMAPDLAAILIAEYTQPSDWVFDPLAGVGTTLVEAIHAGRNMFGIEIEPRWVALARANIALARRQGGTGSALVVRGDATQLPHGVPTALHGRFSLVLTSPPYGTRPCTVVSSTAAAR
jgi:modification methylase